MSKPRPLDYAQIERMRADGMMWREIAGALGWSAASLKDRMNRDGWHEAQKPPQQEPEPQKKATKPRRTPLKEQVYGWLKVGIEPETAATALGKSVEALAGAIKEDLQALKAKARAEAAIELAESIYKRALNGDRAAISQYKRGLL